jgi:hypothetical protein
VRLHLLKKLQCIGTRFAQSPKKTKERKKKEKKDEICSLVLTPKKHINILHYISLWYSAASEKHMQRPIGLAIKQVYFSHLRAIHESRMNMYSDQLKAIYPTLPIDKKRTTNQIDQDLLSERISKAITSIQVTINCIDRFTCLQRWKISSYLSLFGWLVVDGWCWFVLREEYCWLVAGGWFVVREIYCWLVADKPSEQGGEIHLSQTTFITTQQRERYTCLCL